MSACSGSDSASGDSASSDGTDNDSSDSDAAASNESIPGETVVSQSGAPEFCEAYAALEAGEFSPEQLLLAFRANAQALVYLEPDLPEQFRDQFSPDAVDAAREVAEIQSEELDELTDYSDAIFAQSPDDISLDDAPFDELDDEQRANLETLIEFGQLTLTTSDEFGEYFDTALDEACPTLGEGEQSTERIPGSDEDPDGAAPVQPEPQTVTNPPADGEEFSEDVDGPFGGATIANVAMQIESAEWSNLVPSQFGTSGAEIAPEDEDGRILYLTIGLDNQDTNDVIPLSADEFTLVDGGDEYEATQVEGPSAQSDGAEPDTQQSRTFGFDVGDTIDLTDAVVTYQYQGLPGSFGVLASNTGAASDAGYPITVAAPAPLDYVGNAAVGCDVPYTWTVDEASVSIDLPAALSPELPNEAQRSQPGMRWLRLDGAITTGAGVGSCSASGGNINLDFLQLVVDGETLKPSGAPNTVLFENEDVAVDIYWSIPVEAESIEIRAVGRDGLTDAVPVEVPDLPTVDGD